MSRIPEKGKPDFSNLDTPRVRQYRDVVNEMIHAFSEFPEEKEVLTTVWKYLSDECADRLDEFDGEETEVIAAKSPRRNFKIHSRFGKVKN